MTIHTKDIHRVTVVPHLCGMIHYGISTHVLEIFEHVESFTQSVFFAPVCRFFFCIFPAQIVHIRWDPIIQLSGAGEQPLLCSDRDGAVQTAAVLPLGPEEGHLSGM